MKKRKKALSREFFAECGRRGGKKRMSRLSAEEKSRLAEKAVRRRTWRPVRSAPTVVTIPLKKRFWRILDMGRAVSAGR